MLTSAIYLYISSTARARYMTWHDIDCEQSLSSPSFSEVGELAFGELASEARAVSTRA